jgi:hypothetical protein
VNSNSISKRAAIPNAARTPAVRVALALLVTFTVAFVAFAVYATLIAGTTEGPDFITAYQTGQLSPASVASVEVFTRSALPPKPSISWNYYDDLIRQSRIVEPAQLGRLLSQLTKARAGLTHQNHPAAEFHSFLRFHVPEGSYWLELKLLQDETSEVLEITANTLNATNPNGASIYFLQDSPELLSMLKPGDVGEETDPQPSTLTNE